MDAIDRAILAKLQTARHCGSMRCGVHGHIAMASVPVAWPVLPSAFTEKPRTGRAGAAIALDVRRRVGRASLCPPGGLDGSPGAGEGLYAQGSAAETIGQARPRRVADWCQRSSQARLRQLPMSF